MSNSKKGNEHEGPDLMSMEESIRVVEKVVNLFFHNQFIEAEDLLLSHPERWQQPYFYACLSYIKTLFAIFTMEKDIVEEGLVRAQATLDMCHKKRKPSKLSSWFFKQDLNEYTDEEAHIEVIHGEASFMFVVCTFVSDPNIFSLVKAVLKLRECYNAYHFCGQIYREKTNWKNEYMRKNFETGYKTGWGFYNILMSHLPNRILKLLTFVGFPSDRDIAVQFCREVTLKPETYRTKILSFLFCFYSFYLEQFFGCGTAELSWVKEITDRELRNFPDSAFDLFYAARSEQLQGNVTQAIQLFNKCIRSQDQFPQVHSVCKWDLLWSHALKREWQIAAGYALELSEKCNWSKATNLYQYACFKFMMLEETGQTKDEDALKEIIETLKKVPVFKKKIAGRTIPPEKFAITKSNEFLSGKSELILPALELFYIWNIYGAAAKRPELLEPFIVMINQKIEVLHGKSEAVYSMLLLRGVCLRNQNKNEEAIKCFTEILDNESNIKSATYIPPHAAFELGLTHMNVKNYADAKRWLERARDHYTGFLVESLVHLRIHGALSKLREITRSIKRASVVSAKSFGQPVKNK